VTSLGLSICEGLAVTQAAVCQGHASLSRVAVAVLRQCPRESACVRRPDAQNHGGNESSTLRYVTSLAATAAVAAPGVCFCWGTSEAR